MSCRVVSCRVVSCRVGFSYPRSTPRPLIPRRAGVLCFSPVKNLFLAQELSVVWGMLLYVAGACDVGV